MALEIKVPPMGESITEATVAGWRRQPGEIVKSGDILVELETDKVTMEVPSPVDGMVTEIRRKTGETVTLDEVLAIIEPGAASPREASTPQSRPAVDVQEEPRNDRLPPGARRLAEESGVDPSLIQGTGKRGQVTKSDILEHIEKREPRKASCSINEAVPAVAEKAPLLQEPAVRDSSVKEKRVPMSRLRQRIAERLVEAQHSAAILTTFNEVDMSALMNIRNRHREDFEKKHGVKLGFMSFFVKACVSALKEYPAVNAEILGSELVYKYHYDIGVAVGGPKGLVVPVVQNCDTLSMAEIEKEIARLAGKVKAGTITLDEMSGGTFTISNGGIYGSMMSTPILNPPQSGILGMHNITKRAVVENDEIVIRPMMYLALSYDHRVIDGKEAVSFLVRIKEYVEAPERMLLEV